MYAKGMKLPEGKQCAAFITIDLAAEFFWISLDERAKHMPKTLSLGQYGMTHGLPRMLDLLDEFGIKATFFVPGKTAEVYPDAIREVAERGHEIACHGYEYENFGLLEYDEQKERIGKAVAAIEKACGKKPAVCVKPKTPAEAVLPYLELVDLILVMTVEPGFGGQSFMADMMPKVSQIRRYIDARNPACELEVDGGVNAQTARLCTAAGANVLVAGSAFFKAEDKAAFVKAIKE